MEKFNLGFVADLFDQTLPSDQENLSIKKIYTDSREQVENGLFVPIVGERFDAHQFVNDIIDKGAVATFWSHKEPPNNLPEDFPVIYVNDTIQALQQLAHAYRKQVDPLVIGVTGSNGKTTTKELIAACMQAKYQTAKTEGNLNNHIGLPLTILHMDPDVEVLVAEMGMSDFGEIELLSKIAEPDHAVITNIGESHIEFLGSREGIARAKLEIKAGLKSDGRLLIDGDEPLLQQDEYANKIYCGFEPSNDYRVEAYQQNKDSMDVTINGASFQLPLLGKHQALNAAFALAVSELLSIDREQAIKQLESVALPGMRFEKIETADGALLINDAYNASATSMIASLDVIKNMQIPRKIAVLADILELGDYSEKAHRQVGQAIDHQFEAVYTYGTDSRYILDGLSDSFHGDRQHFSAKENLVNTIRTTMKNDTVVLFKGSRSMKLEEIIDELIQPKALD